MEGWAERREHREATPHISVPFPIVVMDHSGPTRGLVCTAQVFNNNSQHDKPLATSCTSLLAPEWIYIYIYRRSGSAVTINETMHAGEWIITVN